MDKLKSSFLKQIMPRALVTYLREHKNTQTYPTWEAAKQAAGTPYSDIKLSRFRADRARLNKGTCQNLPATLAKYIQRFGSNVRVTDFGGATGDVGETVVAKYPGVKYVVVESEVMVHELADIADSVQFTTRIPDQCEIFFTSCTIPYVDAPLEILETGFKSATKACIVARNSFADAQIFRVQTSQLFKNGSGAVPQGYKNLPVKYAHRTTREADIVGVAEKCGFRLDARIDDDSGVLPFKGQVYGGSLLFIRR